MTDPKATAMVLTEDDWERAANIAVGAVGETLRKDEKGYLAPTEDQMDELYARGILAQEATIDALKSDISDITADVEARGVTIATLESGLDALRGELAEAFLAKGRSDEGWNTALDVAAKYLARADIAEADLAASRQQAQEARALQVKMLGEMMDMSIRYKMELAFERREPLRRHHAEYEAEVWARHNYPEIHKEVMLVRRAAMAGEG